MDGGGLVLNFSAPSGDAAPMRMAKPKGGRWKDRAKAVKSVKRQIAVASRPASSAPSSSSSASASDAIVTARVQAQARAHNAFDDFMAGDPSASKEAKLMHGKSQVQSSIFSPEDEKFEKVLTERMASKKTRLG